MEKITLLPFFELVISKIRACFLLKNKISPLGFYKSNKRNPIYFRDGFGKITQSSLCFLATALFCFTGITSWGQINLTDGSNAGQNAIEWKTVLLDASITKKALVHDNNNTNDSQFTTGSKDAAILPLGWEWTSGQTNNKGDISNAGAVIIGDFLYFFGDRASINGDAQIGFWFFLNDVAPAEDDKGAEPFTGTHAVGDILILSNFTNGGGTSGIRIYKWVGVGSPDATDGPFELLGVSDDDIAYVNTGPVTVPTDVTLDGQTWAYKNPAVTQYPIGAFFLGRINLKEPGREIEGCFSSFLLETRNSQSIDASLQDFVSHKFGGEPEPLELTGSSICSSDGSAGTITSTTSATGIKYQLFNSSNVAVQSPKDGTGSGLTWTDLASGDGYYVVGAEADDATCNSTSNQVNVSIIPNPAPSVADQAACVGQTATFSTTNLGTGFTYQWSTGGVDIPNANGSSYTTPTLAIDDNDKVYTVTVTRTGTTCTGSDSGTLTINANPELKLKLTQPSLCGSSTGSIEVCNPIYGATYRLSLDDIPVEGPGIKAEGQQVIFSGLAAGSKPTVTVVTTAGCTATSSCDDAETEGCDVTGPPAAKTSKVIAPMEAKTEKVGFDAYPVPFKNILNIKYNFDYVSNVRIDVFNSQGVLVLSKNDTNSYLNKEVALDLKTNNGQGQVYIVKLTTDRGSSVKKIISSR